MHAQIYANKDFFATAFPLHSKSEAGDALRQFINEYGRPEKLTFDGSQEQCGRKTEFMTNVRKYAIDHHITEPYRPNHNFAEGVIREIRKKWFRVMVQKNVPQRLWDYGLQWVGDIQNRTSNSSRGLEGRCPLERITGEVLGLWVLRLDMEPRKCRTGRNKNRTMARSVASYWHFNVILGADKHR